MICIWMIIANLQWISQHDLAKDDGYIALKRAAEDTVRTEKKDVIVGKLELYTLAS